MSPTQSEAFAAFLVTLTAAQRAALLDCLGSHVENVEYAQRELGGWRKIAELEGHVLLVSLRDATIEAINAPEAPWV